MIVIETIILCDGDNSCPLNGGCKGDGDCREQNARRQLKGSGWLSKGGNHYCPECRKKVSK